MTKDIGWDEKLRVSALRAACASEYETESEFVAVHSHPDGQVGRGDECGEDSRKEPVEFVLEKDERRTERILARAQMFEKWLTREDWETIGQVMNGTRSSAAILGRPVRDNPQA
jgi:hypothetical protein